MRRVRMAVVLMASVLAAGTLPGAQARPGLSPREAFFRRHRCKIVARLDAIHRRGPIETSRDRFIVVALRDEPMHYVQCIFQPYDTAMLCEASSGAYGPGAPGKPAFQLHPQSQAELHALHYVQTDARENFARTVILGNPADVGLAADLMLATLYDAYGAGPGSAISITAPRGGGAGCGTPTS